MKENENSSALTEPKKRTYIGVKLILLISTLVVISMGLITFLVSFFVTADTRINAEANNITLNSRTAYDIENRINSVKSSAALFYDLYIDNKINASGSDSLGDFSFITSKFFEKNQIIATVAILDNENPNIFVNQTFLAKNNIPSSVVNSYLQTENESLNNAKRGIESAQNPSPFFGIPMMSIFFYVNTNINGNVKTVPIVAIFSTEQLSESVATGQINESIFVNSQGIVLVHPDIKMILSAADLSQNVYIKRILNTTAIDKTEKSSKDESNDQSIENGDIQKSYIDTDGTEYYAVSKQITNANCRVITQVKTSIVLAAIRATTRRNIALTIAVLSITILIIWIYSKTLSIPLGKLTAITNEINKGNFNTSLFEKLNIKRTDEIGVLNRSTKNEQDILNTVTHLTNKGVTKAIITKAIDFEPHLKDVTILFSDIREFTAISDQFNQKFGSKSAAQIINFLNDYMTRMVACITATGGTVDKFEGDAIMAVWGALRNDDLSFEQLEPNSTERKELEEKHNNHKKTDALCAITATLAMRYALTKYNKDAAESDATYMPQIKIGCGLNSGRATVGFMGSSQKMEFTSIGDAVNLASRTESSNKPCGTDILITQDTFDLLSDYIRTEKNNFTIKPENTKKEIIVEQIPVTFNVKGKGQQHFYAVVNMPNLDIEKLFKNADKKFVLDEDCAKTVGKNGPKTLSEVRALLGFNEPNYKGIDLDATENKVQII